MRTTVILVCSFFVLLCANSLARAGQTPVGSTFTYQGELKQNGTPVNGTVDFQFKLFDIETGGAALHHDFFMDDAVAVVDGLFTASVVVSDPTLINGMQRWMEVYVRFPSGGVGPYTTLAPRQLLTPAPVALHAVSTGLVPDASLSGAYSQALTFSNPANTYTGNGANLSALNASNISAGTLGGAMLAGTYGNALTLNNAANVFSGNGAGLSGLNASNILSGTLNVARLPSGGNWTLSSALTFDTNVMAIDPTSNNVGIGTTLPNTRLHVIGSENTGLTASMTIGNGAEQLLLDGNEIDTVGTTGLYLNNNVTNNLILCNGGGNVGIGLTSPATRFHVSGADNNGTSGPVRIESGSEFLILDGNEIDTVGTAGLYLNNNVANNVILSAGGGKVGIGVNAPFTPLHIQGGESSGNGITGGLRVDNGGASYLTMDNDEIDASSTLYLNNNNSNNVILANGGGRVGIGANPLTALHVSGAESNGSTTASFRIDGGGESMLMDGNEIDTTVSDLYLNQNSNHDVFLANGGGRVGVGTNGPAGALHVDGTENDGVSPAFIIQNGNQRMYFDGNEIDTTGISPLYLNNNFNNDVILVTGGGNVGIDTGSPLARLHVTGGTDAGLGTGAGGYLICGTTSTTNIVIDNNEIMARNGSGTGTLFLNNDGGNVSISPAGDGKLITPVLQITGGSDLSEGFEVAGDDVKPGMVVVIDPANPGQLMPCTSAYDRKAAGVISGAGGVKTGMMMSHVGTQADGKYPVALTGRVYCMVDASAGAIEPGDMLTTSSKAGHAMKVVDHLRAQGAIIGKAMTPLAQGESGLVLVLVNLQ